MWRIVAFTLFLNSVNSCAVESALYGKICVCNATYCDKPPKVEKLSSEQLQIIFTSDNDPGFNVKGAKFTHSSSADSSVIVEVNSKKTHQKIIGFGGSFTDSTGTNIRSLPAPLQKKIVEAYFAEDGLQYTLCRVPMGGTDFSPRAYTLDDSPDDDEDLKKFSLQKEDLEYKIPFMQLAQTLSKNKMKFFISAWTAPLWMKEHQVWGGYAPLKKQYYQTWSDYAVKFLDACAKYNITYWGLTTGNEPSYGYGRKKKPIFGSMAFTPVDQNVWLKDSLGPTIRKSPYKDLKFIILDDSINAMPWYVPLMLSDNKTIEYVDGVATHWYTDKKISPELNYMAKSDKKDIFLIMSELCFFVTRPHMGSWERAGIVTDSIMEHMQYDYNGYTDWNMVLNMTGEPTFHFPADAAIIVNPEKKVFYKQPFFYVLGHFSKYVRPDSVRVDAKLFSTNSQTNMTVVAFDRPDNLKAVVIFNGANTTEKVQIRDNGKLSEAIEIPGLSLNTVLYTK